MFHTARLMCVLALGAVVLPAQTVPIDAVESTAMIGIATGQTARLNLLNTGVRPPALGVICAATVEYLDASGTVLKLASVMVAPGKSMVVDLHSDTDLSLTAAARREVRATISIPLVPPPTAGAAAAPACKLVPTLEIFDSLTGRTQAILGHVVTVD